MQTMNIASEMEKCLGELDCTRFDGLPRVAMTLGTGLECWCPELWLAFLGAPYAVMARLVGGNVLDVGCGTGFGTACLARLAPPLSLTGLDRSARLIAYARRYAGPSLRFIEGDLVSLPFHDGEFDAVVSALALPHSMTADTARRSLSEMARVLKPGGVLAFSTPNRERSQNLYRPNPDDDPRLRFNPLNRHEYDRDELRSLMSACDGLANTAVNSLVNPAFMRIWTTVVAGMSRKRFEVRGLSPLLAASARTLLPARAKLRYFFSAVTRTRRALGLSLADIARAAAFHPEYEHEKAYHFLVTARRT